MSETLSPKAAAFFRRQFHAPASTPDSTLADMAYQNMAQYLTPQAREQVTKERWVTVQNVKWARRAGASVVSNTVSTQEDIRPKATVSPVLKNDPVVEMKHALEAGDYDTAESIARGMPKARKDEAAAILDAVPEESRGLVKSARDNIATGFSFRAKMAPYMEAMLAGAKSTRQYQDMETMGSFAKAAAGMRLAEFVGEEYGAPLAMANEALGGVPGRVLSNAARVSLEPLTNPSKFIGDMGRAAAGGSFGGPVGLPARVEEAWKSKSMPVTQVLDQTVNRAWMASNAMVAGGPDDFLKVLFDPNRGKYGSVLGESENEALIAMAMDHKYNPIGAILRAEERNGGTKNWPESVRKIINPILTTFGLDMASQDRPAKTISKWLMTAIDPLFAIGATSKIARMSKLEWATKVAMIRSGRLSKALSAVNATGTMKFGEFLLGDGAKFAATVKPEYARTYDILEASRQADPNIKNIMAAFDPRAVLETATKGAKGKREIGVLTDVGAPGRDALKAGEPLKDWNALGAELWQRDPKGVFPQAWNSLYEQVAKQRLGPGEWEAFKQQFPEMLQDMMKQRADHVAQAAKDAKAASAAAYKAKYDEAMAKKAAAEANAPPPVPTEPTYRPTVRATHDPSDKSQFILVDENGVRVKSTRSYTSRKEAWGAVAAEEGRGNWIKWKKEPSGRTPAKPPIPPEEPPAMGEETVAIPPPKPDVPVDEARVPESIDEFVEPVEPEDLPTPEVAAPAVVAESPAPNPVTPGVIEEAKAVMPRKGSKAWIAGRDAALAEKMKNTVGLASQGGRDIFAVPQVDLGHYGLVKTGDYLRSAGLEPSFNPNTWRSASRDPMTGKPKMVREVMPDGRIKLSHPAPAVAEKAAVQPAIADQAELPPNVHGVSYSKQAEHDAHAKLSAASDVVTKRGQIRDAEIKRSSRLRNRDSVAQANATIRNMTEDLQTAHKAKDAAWKEWDAITTEGAYQSADEAKKLAFLLNNGKGTEQSLIAAKARLTDIMAEKLGAVGITDQPTVDRAVHEFWTHSYLKERSADDIVDIVARRKTEADLHAVEQAKVQAAEAGEAAAQEAEKARVLAEDVPEMLAERFGKGAPYSVISSDLQPQSNGTVRIQDLTVEVPTYEHKLDLTKFDYGGNKASDTGYITNGHGMMDERFIRKGASKPKSVFGPPKGFDAGSGVSKKDVEQAMESFVPTDRKLEVMSHFAFAASSDAPVMIAVLSDGLGAMVNVGADELGIMQRFLDYDSMVMATVQQGSVVQQGVAFMKGKQKVGILMPLRSSDEMVAHFKPRAERLLSERDKMGIEGAGGPK